MFELLYYHLLFLLHLLICFTFFTFGRMKVRVLLFLFVLSIGWCCNARVVIPKFFPHDDGILSGTSEKIAFSLQMTLHPTPPRNKWKKNERDKMSFGNWDYSHALI